MEPRQHTSQAYGKPPCGRHDTFLARRANARSYWRRLPRYSRAASGCSASFGSRGVSSGGIHRVVAAADQREEAMGCDRDHTRGRRKLPARHWVSGGTRLFDCSVLIHWAIPTGGNISEGFMLWPDPRSGRGPWFARQQRGHRFNFGVRHRWQSSASLASYPPV